MPNDNNNNCKRIKLAFSSRAGQRETSEYDRLVDTYLLVLTIEGGGVWEGGGDLGNHIHLHYFATQFQGSVG